MPVAAPRVARMSDAEGELVTRRGDEANGGAARAGPRWGMRRVARRGDLARVQRVAELADAMRWPSEIDAARLDGELRLAAAPILADLVGDLARLKALMAGLLDEGTPVRLDETTAAGETGPGADLADFRPGRRVAFDAGDGELLVAPTNPFDALARRTLALLLPEMEQALAELTVLVHEYAWEQDFALIELVESLPGELLAALEEQRPSWDDRAEARRSELARLTEHLTGRRREPEGRPDDAAADLHRALVRAIARAGGGEGAVDGADAAAVGGAAGVREAAAGAVGPLRRLLAALEREGTA